MASQSLGITIGHWGPIVAHCVQVLDDFDDNARDSVRHAREFALHGEADGARLSALR